MLVVKVELHSAVTGEVTELARAVVYKNGGDRNFGNYGAFACRGRDADALQKNMLAILRNEAEPVHAGSVMHHARLRLHVWNLITKALVAMGYGKE